jgi:hypothetical protein
VAVCVHAPEERVWLRDLEDVKPAAESA